MSLEILVMFHKKTKRWLLIALLFLASLRLIMGIGIAVNFAYDWLIKIAFGSNGAGNVAHFVINLCVYVICTTLFIYFAYKWIIKK